MRIISKYKDYYDFYSGIYGIDNKIILDRREGFVPYVSEVSDDTIILHVLDKMYMGYSPKGTTEVFYGEELRKFANKKVNRWLPKNANYVHLGEHRGPFYLVPIDSDKNLKNDCPILIEKWGGVSQYPRLSDLNFHKNIDPFNMWRQLSDWLSMRITEKENTELEMSDSDKAVIKGMDPKTAFRPKMK